MNKRRALLPLGGISYKNPDVASFTTKHSNNFVRQFCSDSKDDNSEENNGIADGNGGIDLGA